VPYLLAMRASVRAPIVVHLHGGARTAAGPESLLLSRLLLRCARRVLAVSPAVAAYAHACLPAAADRVVAVGNGVDPDEFSGLLPMRRERPYVLGIGRLSEEKGFDLLIEGLAGTSTELELLLAGEGPERRRLEHLARERGLATRVHLLGHVDRATLGRLLRGAAMVVIPSRAEGAPLVCQEAMLAGAPLIATDLPAYPPEVRHGETTILVPPGDVRALARALSELAGAPARARALGEAARDAARRFPSWNEVTERILSEYARVVDGYATPGRPEPGVGLASTR
jgi:glycosyltransferase involved in cell wall biosynthesis